MSKSIKNQDFIDRIVIWGCNLLHIKQVDLMRQLAKFVITGFTTTGLDWLVYFSLTSLFGINSNVGILISNGLAWLAGTTASFIISTKWVFNTTKNKSRKLIIAQFFIGALCALGLSEIFIWMFTVNVGMSNFWAKFWTTAITMVFNYITRKLFLEERK